jgi:hypothetical protein
MTRNFFYIIFIMFMILQPLSSAKAGVAERNVFLTEMLSLAEKPKSYFIINLGENKIVMMARGIVIREWIVDDVEFMGEPLPVKPFLLESKSINLAELRINVDIQDKVVNNTGANNTDADNNNGNKTGDDNTGDSKKPKKYELPAMEIDDMPADYQLFLNGGATINVKSRSEGSGIFYSFKRYAYYPILALWASFNKSTSTKIDMSFNDKTEAQALFWAFTEESECIILPPGTEDREDFKL